MLFRQRIAREGSKGNAVLTVPYRVVDKLGARTAGWVRVRFGSTPWRFGYLRRAPSRPSSQIAVPTTLGFPPGDEIYVEIEPAEPYRARTWTEREGFDWLPFVDERYFPTETIDGKLILHSRYEEPFVMRRVTPIEETYRLLGWYQAEGSKSDNAPDFTFANTNVAAIKHYVDLIENAFWIPRERMSLEVLRHLNDDPKKIRAKYEALGVEIVSERARPRETGDDAGIFHVRKSLPFLRMICAAIDRVFSCSWPSREAAREYALGWLDGDGSISIHHHNGYSIEVRFSGLVGEQKVAIDALEHAFEWKLNGDHFGEPRHHTARTLRLDQAADLAAAGGFPFSMNRARLLWALQLRVDGDPGGRSLTKREHVERARKIFHTQLASEWAVLNKHDLAAVGFLTATKGEPYPVKENGPG